MSVRVHPERPIRLDDLAYGGDYNPDQWPEETWPDDVELMRQAGVNLVSLPVFSWPRLEPSPGTYDFGWLDRVLDLLWAGGISVDLATATATPPAWLIRRHPEMLPQTADGVRLEFGSRQAYCPSSPIWRNEVRRMARVMAERYGEHPGVVLWHVSNEYGDHVSRCWCPVSAQHFRSWLTDRYGDIDALNRAWGTSVWGQLYTAFDQIEPPRTATGPICPAQQTDFERFSSDAMLELFAAEVEVLREITPDIPVTTNFMSLFAELDYWDFAAIEDVVTDDAYPDPAEPASHIPAALNYSGMRSFKQGAPWLLLEQAPSAVSWREINVPKPPGQMRLLSMQALAHGADGVMFFQWRQARFGPEKFHSAMLGHRGADSRTFAETRELGRELKQLAQIRGSRVRCRVAMMADWTSRWGMDASDSMPSTRLQWLDQLRAYHAALYALGQPVDLVPPGGPFDDHDVLLLPNQYAVTDEQAEAIRAFVHAGGQLVVGPFSGVVDDHEQVHDGGAPGPLRELLGVEVDEWWPLADGDAVTVDCGADPLTVHTWTEWLEPRSGAAVVGRYRSGPLAGRPALVEHDHGAGRTLYLSCVPAGDGLVQILRPVLERAGLPTLPRTTPVEIVTRSDGRTDYTFLLNHGDQTVSVPAPAGGRDLLTGAEPTGDGDVILDRYGVAVLAHPSPEQAVLPVPNERM